MKLTVTSKGPIDRHQPGADVTGMYDAETAARLVEDGYLEEVKPKRKPKGKVASNGN